jgi:hypothetical protein
MIISVMLSALPEELLSLYRKGSIQEISQACGKAVNEDNQPEDLAKIYMILAFSYILTDTEDAVDRCSGLLELLPEHSEMTPAVTLIKVLAEESKKESVDTGKFTVEWQAAADMTFYLQGLKHNISAEDLYAYFKDYNNKISNQKGLSWIKAFKGKFAKWQTWIQNGKGDKSSLPPLVSKIQPGSKKVIVTEAKAQPTANEGKLIAGINQVIQDYLAEDIENGKKKAEEILKETPTNSDYYEIINYLSKTDLNNADQMMNAKKYKASEWALASIAMFVKDLLTTKGVPDKYKLYFYLDNFDGNVKLVKNNSAINAWIPFSQKWRKWIDSGFKNKQGLEHILITHSSDAPVLESNVLNKTPEAELKTGIMEISEEDFIEGRKDKYSARPRPASLEFDDIKSEVDDYFNSLPPEEAAKERERLKGVKKVKHYIIRIMERTPYTEGIIVKKKKDPEKTRKIRGIVYLANKYHLRIKKSKKSKKGRNYDWEDLAMVQYERFIDFFAQRRLNMTGAAESKKTDIVSDAANDYIALALLLDWYGYYADALKYAKIAVETKPEFSEKFSKLFLD